MKFKLKGVMWQIKFALVRVESIKNDLIAPDMDSICEYLAKESRIDAKEVAKIIEAEEK